MSLNLTRTAPCLAISIFVTSLPAADWDFKPDPPADEFKLADKAEFSQPVKAGGQVVVIPTSASRYILLTQQAKPGEDARVVYDLQTMKEVGRLTGGTALLDYALSPDGNFIAGRVLGGAKPTVEIYAVSTGKSVNKIEVDAKPGLIKMVDFAGPDQLITAKHDGLRVTYRTWDIKTGKQGVEFQSNGIIDDKSEAFSPGRKYMAVSDDGKVVLVDLSTGKPAGEIVPPKPNNFGKYNCKALTFSSDGKLLAGLFFFTDSRIVSWDLTTGKQVADRTITGNLQQLAQNGFGYQGRPLDWLPDQSGWLAYGQLLIDGQSGKVAWKLPVDPTDGNPRKILDHDQLLMVSGDVRQKKLELHSLPRKEIDAAIELVRSGKDPGSSQLPAAKVADWSAVQTIPIPTGSVDWKAKVEAAAKPAKNLAVRPLTLHGKLADMNTIVFTSADIGQAAVLTCAAAGNVSTKKQVHVDRYDLAAGKLIGGADLFLTEPPQGQLIVLEADLCPDGTAILIREPRDKKRVDVWSLDQNQHIAGWLPFENETDPVVSWLAFIDAKRVLIANAAGKLVLWSVPECKAVYSATGCKGIPSLSPDRHYLAAYNGATYDLIDTATGERHGQLSLPKATTVQQVETAAFRLDGKALAAAVRHADLSVTLTQWELKADSTPTEFVVRQPGQELHWSGNDHILLGQSLLDLKLKLPLTTYLPPAGGTIISHSPDGRCWFRYARTANDPVVLAVQAVPDGATTKLAAQIAKKTAEPVYMPGKSIKLKIEGSTPEGDADGFRKGLTERLTAYFELGGLKIADDADLILTANVQPEHPTGQKIEFSEIGSGAPKTITVLEKEVEVRWTLADRKGATLWEQKTFGRMHGTGLVPGSAEPAAYLMKGMWDNACNTPPPLPAALVRINGKLESLPKPVILTGD